MKITIIGTGYVGLVTGACFAETGNQVVCVDTDEKKINRLQKGDIPFYEPGLAELVLRNQKEGRLQFVTSLKTKIENSSIAFVCVGTPPQEDGSANLDYVFKAAGEIADVVSDIIVCIKSTVPVGTASKIRQILNSKGKSHIPVVSNPEFLREGSAVEDCLKPDRIVIGTDSETATEVFKEIYQPFVRTGNPIFVMDNVSAEMTKYVSNCILAARISFINEMSMLCEKVGGNLEEIRKAVGSDHRIGMQYLFPSIGFGGSCFPKDVKAMTALFHQHDVPANMLTATLQTNETQKKRFCERIRGYFEKKSQSLSGKKIALWGAAFKARTDDIRESPALDVIDFLLKEKAKVFLYDPKAMENIRELYGSKITCVDDPYVALEDASALCVLTEWNQFRHPDFVKIKKSLAAPVIFDGRNLYEKTTMADLGFEYFSIGQSASIG